MDDEGSTGRAPRSADGAGQRRQVSVRATSRSRSADQRRGSESDATGSGAAPRRRGRPTGGGRSDAKERIVSAARAEFGRHGYDKATMRSIARSAGVDSALVHHYFGTKEGLFAAAIEVSFAPALAAQQILEGDREALGERLARLFLTIWEAPSTREPLLVIIRSAMTAEPAAAAMREFVWRELTMRAAAAIDVPNPQLRAQLAASHMVGLAILRYVIKVEPLASMDLESLVAMVAPSLQRYFTDPHLR